MIWNRKQYVQTSESSPFRNTSKNCPQSVRSKHCNRGWPKSQKKTLRPAKLSRAPEKTVREKLFPRAKAEIPPGDSSSAFTKRTNIESWRKKTVIEFAPSVIASIYLVNDEQQKSSFFSLLGPSRGQKFFFYVWVLAADCRRGHAGVSKVEIWRRRVGTAQVEQKTCEANFHAMFERFFN